MCFFLKKKKTLVTLFSDYVNIDKILLYFQRERTKKLYTDDWAIGDEEIEGRRTFQLDEKIECERYNLSNFTGLFRIMTGPELNVAYLQKHGLGIPLLFRDKAGLGLRVPSANFSINDVRTCVGMFVFFKEIFNNSFYLQGFFL